MKYAIARYSAFPIVRETEKRYYLGAPVAGWNYAQRYVAKGGLVAHSEAAAVAFFDERAAMLKARGDEIYAVELKYMAMVDELEQAHGITRGDG